MRLELYSEQTLKSEAHQCCFFFFLSSLSLHYGNTLPLKASIRVSLIYCVRFMGNMILWHLQQSVQPTSVLSNHKSVPTWHSTCLVSAVSASVTSTFKLGVNADRSCVIHLKVHHNAGCRQLSGGAHSLIVQPSSVAHYVRVLCTAQIRGRIWRKCSGCLRLPVFHWFWFIKRQHFLRLSSARLTFVEVVFRGTSRQVEWKSFHSSQEVVLVIKEVQKNVCTVCVFSFFFSSWNWILNKE